MIPNPMSAFQDAEPLCFAVSFNAAMIVVDGCVGNFERSAATTPATTGHAADVPESIASTPEPAKWLYPAISGFWEDSPPGPCEEYPSRSSLTVTAATQVTAGLEFAP